MKRILLTTLSAIVLFSCKKQTEALSTPALSDYFPLKIGNTLFYRLDSTVSTAFGASLTVKSYQAKDSVEATFTDNQGRLSYRIYRYIRDTAGLQPWRFASTLFATPTDQAIEYVENNMRFVKLTAPLRAGYSFKAHSFIDTKPPSPVSYLDEWDYMYEKVGERFTIKNRTFDSTITVFQQDETSPNVPFNPNEYQQRNYGREVYAKGVGLIYKEFLHWTWQAAPVRGYEDGSYGVKLTLLP
jgi:hypothetical protein